ncbi:MAG: hypothetical protein ACI8U3_001282 [Brevundimonas sp.]|jgi:hypothetical protein
MTISVGWCAPTRISGSEDPQATGGLSWEAR